MRWRLLLWPFAVLYDVATRFRNHLYNIGHKPSFKFEIPVISVGNLNAGGSGKTPMVEYLIRLMSPTHKIATLSRGYGRITRGIKFASPGDDAATIGDEPYQFHRKFGSAVKVAVGEERVLAVPTLLNEYPDIDLIVLDDAFQHRRIRPWFSILVTEYGHLFTRDYVLPAGNLREARKGASRADVIVVTKCPDDIKDEVDVVASVKKYAGEKPVFFSSIRYGKPISFGSGEVGSHVVVITGIAHSEPFVSHLSRNYQVVRHFRYRDHHRYTEAEVTEVLNYARLHNASIVTTEKDAGRLQTRNLTEILSKWPCYYIPIEMVFRGHGEEFDHIVKRNIRVPTAAS